MARARGGNRGWSPEQKHKQPVSVGADWSSMLIRDPCAQKLRKSEEVRVGFPKSSPLGRGTSPPNPMLGTDEEGVGKPQFRSPASTEVIRLDPLGSCSSG